MLINVEKYYILARLLHPKSQHIVLLYKFSLGLNVHQVYSVFHFGVLS